MLIRSVELKNFRNIESAKLDFKKNINIFIGKNAQGKTNLIESFFILSVCRSFRTRLNKQLITFNKEYSSIKASVISNNKDLNLEVIFTNKSKKAKINTMDIKKTSDFIGYLNVVVFTPDDLLFVKGGPSERRNFVDLELSKISPIFLFNLSKYNNLLKERNKYLKTNFNLKAGDLYIESLNEQMAECQVVIIKKRQMFIKELSLISNNIYQEIANDKEIISLNYKTFVKVIDGTDLYSTILEKYKNSFDKDILTKQTNVGIHKDDIDIFLNKKNAYYFSSQGQQRTIVLSIKIALLEIIKNEIGEYPVLLLDDVLSELDKNRKEMLFKILDKKIQTFITTTSIDDIDIEITKKADIFYIENGKSRRINE